MSANPLFYIGGHNELVREANMLKRNWFVWWTQVQEKQIKSDIGRIIASHNMWSDRSKITQIFHDAMKRWERHVPSAIGVAAGLWTAGMKNAKRLVMWMEMSLVLFPISTVILLILRLFLIICDNSILACRERNRWRSTGPCVMLGRLNYKCSI
jgi:hypothetical protein